MWSASPSGTRSVRRQASRSAALPATRVAADNSATAHHEPSRRLPSDAAAKASGRDPRTIRRETRNWLPEIHHAWRVPFRRAVRPAWGWRWQPLAPAVQADSQSLVSSVQHRAAPKRVGARGPVRALPAAVARGARAGPPRSARASPGERWRSARCRGHLARGSSAVRAGAATLASAVASALAAGS